ncbi:unnamed protein product [Sphenostylis stenocarpa]|uniref:TF-B3 domain-containing protein n=1 Tax=Sphenostylis stenocarpa TaxID=92480 RepID=A0AA87B9Y0_9FABA|nr:unnamed protein product [Sphenostylis stenocarpa]
MIINDDFRLRSPKTESTRQRFRGVLKIILQLQISLMDTHPGQSCATLPINFFKIIIETNVERIKLPNKFTRRYGGGLSNPVSLKSPDIKEWVVHWTKENGDIWLEKGWKEFVENYSLVRGHLVLFKYAGTSNIDVLILDQSGLELDYSSSESVRQRNVERDPNVLKLLAVEGICSDQRAIVSKTIKQKPEDVNPTQSGTCLNMPPLKRAQQITTKFKSSHVYFTLVIRKSKFEKYAATHVPRFLDCVNGKQDVMLKMGDKLWCVNLVRGRDKRYDRFCSGWSIFAQESKLESGDVCIFELIKPEVPLLQVHVFKR